MKGIRGTAGVFEKTWAENGRATFDIEPGGGCWPSYIDDAMRAYFQAKPT